MGWEIRLVCRFQVSRWRAFYANCNRQESQQGSTVVGTRRSVVRFAIWIFCLSSNPNLKFLIHVWVLFGTEATNHPLRTPQQWRGWNWLWVFPKIRPARVSRGSPHQHFDSRAQCQALVVYSTSSAVRTNNTPASADRHFTSCRPNLPRQSYLLVIFEITIYRNHEANFLPCSRYLLRHLGLWA